MGERVCVSRARTAQQTQTAQVRQMESRYKYGNVFTATMLIRNVTQGMLGHAITSRKYFIVQKIHGK